MFIDVGFSTLLAVVLFAAAILYRFSYLQKKKIWYLSIQQMMIMVIIPGIIFPFLYAYLRSIQQVPRNPYAFLPDALLTNIVLLAFMFAYGGTAIHAVTKMLSDYLKKDTSELAEIIRFFHWQFSHVLSYSAAMVAFMGLVLLEMSHIPLVDSGSIWGGVLKAVGLGVAVFFGLHAYTVSDGDDYRGRWSDLKIVFLVFWIGFILFLLGLKRMKPDITDYQLLFPAMGVFGVMMFLSTVLVIRRVGRRWQFRVKQKALEQYMRGEDED